MVGRGFDFMALVVGFDDTARSGVSSSLDKSIVSFSLLAMSVAEVDGCCGCDDCAALFDGEAETFFEIMLTELFICNF